MKRDYQAPCIYKSLKYFPDLTPEFVLKHKYAGSIVMREDPPVVFPWLRAVDRPGEES